MVDYKVAFHMGVAGMTPQHRRTLIIETIRALQTGVPVSKGRVTLILEPWPDLFYDAMEREGDGWVSDDPWIVA